MRTAAAVLGASGSVGDALVKALIRSKAYDPIITLGRRSQAEQVAMARSTGVELREILVSDMRPESLERATLDATAALDGEVSGFSVLGIGAGTAKLTIAEHRAVDVDLNAAFARALRNSGRAKHLAFMSAVGADATAAETGSGAAGMPRYARVKGESEAAVQAAGPLVVSIFRPSMIIGSTHTPWVLGRVLPLLSVVTPAKFRSITVDQIAAAMIAVTREQPAASAIYHFSGMMARQSS